MRRLRGIARLLAAACVALAAAPAEAQLFSLPSSEMRTVIAERHELRVQRNGRLDVLLRSGQRIFDNAEPAALLAGETEPGAFRINARNTAREAFHDRLGAGQGLAYRSRDGHEWHVRVFPGEPFIAVQCAYINTGDEPVRVAALVPWRTARENRGHGALGRADDGIRALLHGARAEMAILEDAPLEAREIACLQTDSGAVLAAGFLTAMRGAPEIRIERLPADDDEAPRFALECRTVYDPPVELAPGERLDSEVLYLGISETDAPTALARYGEAAAKANEWPAESAVRVAAVPMPDEIDAASLATFRAAWDAASAPGWRPAAWLARAAPAEGFDADPAFAAALNTASEALAGSEVLIGAEAHFFRYPAEGELPAARPTWFKALPGENDAVVLDISAPGAADHVRDRAAALREAGLSFLAGLPDLAAAGRLPEYDGGITGVEALRRAIAAIREGFGPEGVIWAAEAPPLLSAGIDGLRIPPGRLPAALGPALQERAPDADAAAYAVRRCFWRRGGTAPVMTLSGAALGLDAAAMLGAHAVVPSVEALARLASPNPQPVRPLDLFENDAPQAWLTAPRGSDAPWRALALFNWDRRFEAVISTPLSRLGAGDDDYFFAFDATYEHYLGVVQGRADVEAPPAAQRVLVLRPRTRRPAVVGGAMPLWRTLPETEPRWDPAQRRLEGHHAAGPSYVWAPEDLRPVPREGAGDGSTDFSSDGPVVRIAGPAGTAWTIAYAP